ncbi:MAG TPA: hypothetical protein PLL54_10925 [Dermatophilaceae bacterium]|nr:hypothetical protein [Dermatophilaceae bacterium]
MSNLTPEQTDLVRGAAFGAMAVVSKADPGFFAMFKESMAGAKALASAPPEIQAMLKGGFVTPPAGAAQDLEGTVLAQLASARDTLAANAPELLDGFRSVVLAACDATADASGGVSEAESTAIEKIRTILSAGGGASIVEGAAGSVAPADGAHDAAEQAVEDNSGPWAQAPGAENETGSSNSPASPIVP